MTTTHPQFLLYVGDTWTIDATLHDGDGSAINLAGADDIEWNLRDRSKRLVASLRISNGVEIINEAGGQCRITLSPMRTALLAEGIYTDQIVVTMSDGTVSTQSVGPIVATKPGSQTAPDLSGDLAALKAQRRSGIAETQMENFRVTYRSDAEIAAAIAATQNEIAGASQTRNIVVRSKGWSK